MLLLNSLPRLILESIEHVPIVLLALALIVSEFHLHTCRVVCILLDPLVGLILDLSQLDKIRRMKETGTYLFHEFDDGVLRHIDHSLITSFVNCPI